MAGGVGLSPAEWEDLTPAAFRAWVTGYIDAEKARAENRQVQNYNLAVMVRAAIGEKHMPDYKKFFPETTEDGKKKPMTDEQMYQQVLALNAALGGTVSGG